MQVPASNSELALVRLLSPPLTTGEHLLMNWYLQKSPPPTKRYRAGRDLGVRTGPTVVAGRGISEWPMMMGLQHREKRAVNCAPPLL